MPRFSPGEEKTAIVTMTNPTARAFDYRMVLYMGVNMVAMGDAEFSLEAGESSNISIPVVMPASPGVYPVYLDVWSGETLLGHYQANENVEIAVEESHFAYSSISCWEYSAGFKILQFRCSITNEGDHQETHLVNIWKYRADLGRASKHLEDSIRYTLDPGESVDYAYPTLHSGDYGYRWCFFASDDGGGQSGDCCVYVG
jgi:hypothetical protein